MNNKFNHVEQNWKMGRSENVRRLSNRVTIDTSLTPSVSLNHTDFIDIQNSTNTNSDSSSSGTIGLQNIITAVIASVCFLILLSMCIFMKSTHTPDVERRIRRYERGGYKKKSRKHYRLKQIRKSITVKHVVQVDKCGQVQLSDVCSEIQTSRFGNKSDDEVGDIENASSFATVPGQGDYEASEAYNENLVACCCICLEPYCKGDIIASSNRSTDDCSHIFHRDCIQLWLANPKHNDCPSCRTPILIVPDEASFDSDDEDKEEDAQGRLPTTDLMDIPHTPNENTQVPEISTTREPEQT